MDKNPNHLIILASRHSSLKTLFESTNTFAGSIAPRRFIELIGRHFAKVTVFYPTGDRNISREFEFQGGDVSLVPVSVNRVVAAFQTEYHLCQMVRTGILKADKMVFYGMGYYAITAYILQKIWKRPSFARIFGTFLADIFVDKKLNKTYLVNAHKLFAETLAFKSPNNGIIISNDGTRGDLVCQALEIPEERILFIRNGIDLENVYKARDCIDKNLIRKNYNLAENDFVLISVSRLTKWKRHDLTINLLHRTVEITSGLGCRPPKLVIVGAGADYDYLLSYVQKLGLIDSVIFTDALPQPEVWNLMSSCDLFVSLFEVGNIGNVTLEAIALGLPVIARDTGDTKKFILSNYNGYLLPAESNELIESGAQIISELMRNKERVSELRMNVAKFATEYLYSWPDRIETEANFIHKKIFLSAEKSFL